MTTFPGVSMRRVCRVLGFSRARLRARAVVPVLPARVDGALAVRIQQLIERHPTFGYRRLWTLLRFRQGAWKGMRVIEPHVVGAAEAE